MCFYVFQLKLMYLNILLFTNCLSKHSLALSEGITNLYSSADGPFLIRWRRPGFTISRVRRGTIGPCALRVTSASCAGSRPMSRGESLLSI